MPGFIELAVMVFALVISFAVFLVHKGIKEKEVGLSILAIVLFIAGAVLTFIIIFKVLYEGTPTISEEPTVHEMAEEVIN
jgi:lysylphosphatidylglycerol synthetase-like protein (DUF2156 family)